MGSKSWILVYSNGSPADTLATLPAPDVERTTAFAEALFPEHILTRIEDGNLLQTAPRRREVCAGSFADVHVVAASEFGKDRPSELPRRFIEAAPGDTVCLLVMYSVVDWFAYAVWHRGELVRSLSVTPDSGVKEDLGERLPFELPYWEGAHPVEMDGDEVYPLDFHPLEMGEAALLDRFGYQIEGGAGVSRFEPDELTLLRFRRTRARPWWKFWSAG